MTAKKVLEPGMPVRHSQSGQPIMVTLDLLGRRWTLRILWTLRNGERMTSRRLQSICEITSPNVLTSRLRELRGAGVVALEEKGGYVLTEQGQQLLMALGPLAEWSEQWARNVGRADLACYTRKNA